MKANLIAVAIFCAIFSLAGCHSSPQNLIIGKWKCGQSGIKISAEFERDGTAKLTMFGQTVQGAYKFEGDDLAWTLNEKTTKMKAKVTANELELTGNDGNTLVYQRE